MLQGMGPAGIGLFDLFVFAEKSPELFQFFIESALDHDGLHMVDQGCVGAPLGDRALGGVVRIVDVEVGKIADGDVRITIGGKGGALAGQKFEIAVGAHVDNHIRTEIPLQVAIGRHVLVGGRDVRVVQDLAYLAVTPRPRAASFGLYTDHRIAVLHSGHQDLPVVDHGGRHAVHLFAGRLSPSVVHALADFRRQGVEPSFVFLPGDLLEHSAFLDDLVHRGPAEFADRLAPHNRFDQLPAVRRRVNAVACRLHAVHHPGDTFERIQVRAAAYRSFHRGAGAVQQNKCHFAFRGGFLSQSEPAGHPPGDLSASFRDGGTPLQFASHIARAADNERLDHSFEFGHGDHHADPWAKPFGIAFPVVNRLVIHRDRGKDRNIEALQDFHPAFGRFLVAGVLLIGAAEQVVLQPDERVDAGRSAIAQKEILNDLSAAFAAQVDILE